MDLTARNKMIAEYTGLTLDQVGGNVAEAYRRDDGSWMVHFGYQIERNPEISRKLKGIKDLVIPTKFVSDWSERGNG